MEIGESSTGRYGITQIEPVKQTPTLKKCIFCAELIQADALKCRFCGEFLNTDKAKAVQRMAEDKADGDKKDGKDSNILFAGRPSLFGLVGSALKGAVILAVAYAIMRYPLEELAANWAYRLFGYALSDGQYFAIADYRGYVGIGLVVLVMLVLLWKVLKLKMTYYEVTSDRIEHSRGILDRKVDNLDMFRVIDLKLRRSLLDCVLGIGQVTLITTDKSDPKFTFQKIRGCRKLYDVIKKASLAADQKQRVIHLE